VRDFLALEKLCHTLDGLYIWEFFTTLDFEWRVIRGCQPYRWTIWLYSLTRLTTLMTVIINLVTLNLTTKTNCQVWITTSYTCSYMSFALSSLLIVLRIVAVWNTNKGIVGFATIVWGINASLGIQGIVQIRSSWISEGGFCGIPNIKSNTVNIISMLVSDLFLLAIMLVGLFRLRCRGTGSFALGRLLWKQGVIWLLLATIAELPLLVFICLDLNDAFDQMFLMPSYITMSIAATRIYRSLADFASTTEVAMDSGKPPGVGRNVPTSKLMFAVPTSSNRAEVAVHTSHEQHPISSTDQDVIYIGRESPDQLSDKPRGLSFDDDPESDVEK